MKINIETYQHKEWLGLLQPVGLVVSPVALVKAQAAIDRSTTIELQQRLQTLISTESIPGKGETNLPWVSDFPLFAQEVLEWLPEDLVGSPQQEQLPTELEVVLPDYGETLRPTYGVRNLDDHSWIILVQTVAPGLNLDELNPESELGWKATIQAKFERLLRETQIPIGLLFNGVELRLVYAPRGESSGHLTFPLWAMTEVSGRLILGALYMLLSADRLFNVPSDRRLPKILSDSRDYQAEVSTKLASQVLDALWELLRGFQSADALVKGNLLQKLAKEDPQHIYGGLITTLMRLVFLLYAEDEGLMPDDTVYQQNYAVSGLYFKLREDVSNYPDTMDQRYGAWTWLLSLFRLVYDGGGHTPQYLPARHGQLFDPNQYPFLEGRQLGTNFQNQKVIEAPRIADGVIYRILDKLLMLEGERLSYRALDVEQIGSVYEAIMGFEVESAQGISIALRPKDVVVNIEAILAAKPSDRSKIISNQAELKLSTQENQAIQAATNPQEFLAALERKISPRTPNLLLASSLYLQPGDERRLTGSHYTPRKLTQPIVATTLKPVLEALGEHPTAEAILQLKICDIAMGSGAFLVESCRQLAEKVVEAWTWHGELDKLDDQMEPLLEARRLVAQKCLYGVDKNPFAVNLAKLSLWLVTLAKNRPFTFVDHALKWGDSLVGINRSEIADFGKDTTYDTPLLSLLKGEIDKAKTYRLEIQTKDSRNNQDADAKQEQLAQADAELQQAKLIGDVIVASFFAGKNKKQRQQFREEYSHIVGNWRNEDIDSQQLQSISDNLRSAEKPILPFHWDLEFPEVFDRDNHGFDAIIGNQPFLGGWKISSSYGDQYLAWIKEVYPESGGQADIVAYFFRQAFQLIRQQGVLGLIATNTIAQGDTRTTGLRFICNHGGTIYNAQKRFKWPGLASVTVSLINIYKGIYNSIMLLDGQIVTKITAFLFHAGSNNDPSVLIINAKKSFNGSKIYGQGFLFDDNDPQATPIAEMHRLIKNNYRNAEVIFPYIGGQEVNSSPTHAYHRYVINFGEMSETEAREKYPDLMAIVEEKVKPQRLKEKRSSYRKYWWQYGEKRVQLFNAITQCDRILVSSCGATAYLQLVFLPNNMVYSHSLAIFSLPEYLHLSLLQSRINEIWVRFFGSSLGDTLRYTLSDCFETFPFPPNGETDPNIEAIGKTYYEHRAELMLRNNQGLTDTYNRFHDPDEYDPDILKLRELHSQMDAAVLEAYGWSDIDNSCGFGLDYLDVDPDDDNIPFEVQERVNSGDLFFATAEEASAFNSIARTGKRKLPWRYRWPETTHDEVLTRLLDLNQKRADEEKMAGLTTKKKRKSSPKKKDVNQLEL